MEMGVSMEIQFRTQILVGVGSAVKSHMDPLGQNPHVYHGGAKSSGYLCLTNGVNIIPYHETQVLGLLNF